MITAPNTKATCCITIITILICTGCPSSGTPPSNMAITAQTSVTYGEQHVSQNAWVGTNTWYLTVQGRNFGPNAQVTVKSSNVPGQSGLYTFGTAKTDKSGSFTLSTSGSAFTSDQSYWNVDVHVTAQQNNTGWFEVAEVNGGIFVNCLPIIHSPSQLSVYTLNVSYPPWQAGRNGQPGQNYSCPQLPPPSGSGGSSGGACPVAGTAGCACNSGGQCNSGLVCVNGSECLACGGNGQPCCSNNACSTGLRCQASPAQGGALSCLP